MKEIRIHGRGGQGAVTAGIILAQAYFNNGEYVQTFPIFGVERRGAPVAAYVRVDSEEILQRYNVYSPHHVIVLDRALIDMDSVDVYAGIRMMGSVFINGVGSLGEGGILMPKYTNHYINATEIALKYGLGHKQAPIVNTTMVGAYLGYYKIPIEHCLAAVEEHCPNETEANKKAFEEGYNVWKR
jgi:2-oxoacid:acceptor oxidoreductase gamma subunit (pyruvate/2-ketoisovalerate family)